MTAIGFLCPGHRGEDDYPRIEQLLAGAVRLDLVHTGTGEDAHAVDPLHGADFAGRLTAAMEGLRLTGAEAVVWTSPAGGFAHGWKGAHTEATELARQAGLPASSTSLGFVHAAQALGVRKVAVAHAHPPKTAALFRAFLADGGLEVTGAEEVDALTAERAAEGDEAELLALARAADTLDAEAVLLPDTSLRTAAHLSALEAALGKPVLTASQVSVWEGLRLADRRLHTDTLGALFTREPVVQR
ncbi:aspartate racemase/maleate isomerase family protein [Streptomyces griseoluteus]|uniref:aspartate racemase/maleate isomerase family protein n=1 Tax=Streptomyces griseoluteus TaxID=29306 RepID=UPI00369D6541